ncbi:GATA transcription factor 9-like isoform X2 [Prosopis cineraria]|uniref:GATA transcription factor 9-like isoform X2 n=1 Tax=Prosopis cineraria TaxID=364024 RepID=UPI00240EAED6|nr:GATA transcription factor 9-like isoform X2 [Prosopis cineraria]
MLMEVPEYFVGGYFSAGGDQFSPEKRHGADQKPGEPFAIDDLLDFSNADAMIMSDGFFDNAAGNSTVTAVDSCNSSVSGGDNHFSSGNAGSRGSGDPQLSGELCVPYDDLAELEWLSNFVEDSFSVEDELQTLHLISGTTSSAIGTKPQTPESSSSSETLQHFAADTARNAPLFHPETPLPGKARSKRTRAAPGDWSTRFLHLITPTVVPEPAQAKAAAKKRESSNSEYSSGRKCLHCAADKTPQWRTGPMGPKTLCNACGVRYKSGRLVPEYRPAASPTFVLSKHSNSHRKVMELRRQKEMQRQQHQQLVSHNSIFGVSHGEMSS